MTVLDLIIFAFFMGALVTIFFDPITSIACWVGWYLLRDINV